MRRFNLKKLLCVVFAVILLVVSMPTTVFAASYPSIIIVSSESTTTVMKGEEGLLRFMIIPQYKNEKYHVEMYNSNGTRVASVEDTYYNSSDTYQRYVNINVDTAELDLAVGTYTVKYWLSFYSLYQWNDAPNKYTYTFNVTPYVCSGEHVYDNSCDANCNACDEYRTPTHAYSGNCDASCNVCGDTRTVSTNHAYSNSTDTTCNVCGYTRVIIPQDNSRIIASGTCGANLTWKLTANGTLTISGTGNMYNYSSDDNQPWVNYRYNFYDYYIKNVIIEEGVTSIGNYAFYFCDIEKISIASTVKRLGEHCFSNSLLREVVVPDGIKTIPYCAFDDCEVLQSVVIPSSVQSFGDDCFRGTALEYFIIPDGVTKISNGMFWDCSSLEYVQIPSSVTYIDTFAFHECSYLSDIYFTGSKSQYSAIEVESLNEYNEGLLNVTVHYNTKAPCVFCQYDAWIKVDNNNHKHICVNCGKTETASHNWDAGIITKQPTCLETGVKNFTCLGCGATRTSTIVKTTDHTYGNWSNVDSNNHKHSCTVCGKEETVKHNWNAGVVTKQPNCLETGIKNFTCIGCGTTKTTTIVKTTDHTYGNWSNVDSNNHKRSCTVCGKEETEKHSWDAGVITKQPTCLEEGIKTYTCTGCNSEKTTAIAKTTVHTYGSWSNKDNNNHKHSCVFCGKEQTEAHTWSSGEISKFPTFTQVGKKEFTCHVCDTSVQSDIAKLKNGWNLIDGKWYFGEKNALVKDAWRKDSKGWVYLGSDGAMKTNAWVRDSVGWCYVGADGYAVTNCWKKDSTGWCYLNSEGSMVKNNWVYDGGKWYFIDGNGYMISNKWQKDSKGWVYLGSDGAMKTNAWVRDSVGWCYVGADGYAVTNCWKKDSVGWCYLNSNGSMVKNNWVLDGGKWYYLNGNGYMISSTWRYIGGKNYYFNASGICTNP